MRRTHGRALAALALLLVTMPAPDAEAQLMGGQRFTPAASEDGIFETEGADRRILYLPYVALWLQYANAVVTLVDESGEQVGVPVEHLFAADLVAAVTVWEGLEFGVGLPLTLYSWGDGSEAQSAGLEPAPGFALGDLVLRVGYRFRLADHSALAIHVPVLLPTSGAGNILGLGVGGRPTIAFLQRLGPVELLVNLFVLLRTSAEALDFRGGHELGLRLGARFAVDRSWRTAVLGEVGFSTAFASFFSAASTPAEIRLGLEHWFDRHWRISGFLGTGISPSVGSPDVRLGVAVAFGDNPPWRPRPNPRTRDRDGDGILDSVDACPTRAEDPDGFEDQDGCPDEDNDSDGVLDWEDACPTAPETENGISDDDGCPDFVVLSETLITTFEPVHFRTGSDEILERSFPMLEEIAGVLEVNRGMGIRVEGHTDSVGDDETNLELSQRRAESVRRFLIEHGVPGGRLEARGFGETRPVASNSTDDGRSRNRRVEFHILSEEEE